MAIHWLPSGILLAMDWLPSGLHQYKHFEPISNLPACFNVPPPLLPRSYSVPTPYLQRILNETSYLHQYAHLLAAPYPEKCFANYCRIAYATHIIYKKRGLLSLSLKI